MASGKTAQGSYQPDSDVHISYEDQQKINEFAKQNAKLDDLKEEIKIRENICKNIDDARNEISLMDNDEKISYRIGDLFITQDIEKSQKCLEQAEQQKLQEMMILMNKLGELRCLMSDLKSQLYGKFGSHINLETEENEENEETEEEN